jgi:hypothetical protein
VSMELLVGMLEDAPASRRQVLLRADLVLRNSVAIRKS